MQARPALGRFATGGSPARAGRPVPDLGHDVRVLVPFAPLEDAVAHAERPGFPLTIQLEVWLRGRVDEHALRAALVAAAERHPLACARRAPMGPLDRVQFWDLRVAFDVDPVISREYLSAADFDSHRDRFLSESIPIDVAPLFRVVHARLPHHDVLLLSVNHASMDGLGAVAFLRSVLAVLAGRRSAASDEWAHARWEMARRSASGPLPGGDGQISESDPMARTGAGLPRDGMWRSVADPVRAFAAAPRTARIQPSRHRNDPGYGVTHRLVRGAGSRPTLLPSALGVSTNDLLVAALHRTIADWNLDHGVLDERIGVTMPVSTRSPGERLGVVANLTLQSSTITTRADRSDARALRDSIAAQTRSAKSDGDASEPAAVLGMVSFVPARVRRRIPGVVSTVTRDRFVDSARVSNLGRLSGDDLLPPGPRVPDAVEVDQLWFSPPVRMPQGVTLGAVGFDGALALSFRWCRALFDHASAARFADQYVRALAEVSLP